MLKQSLRRIFAFFLMAALLAAFTPLPAARADASGKKLTVMAYAIGTDLESTRDGGGFATRYIIQMIRSAFSREDINVVLITGGARHWATGYPTDCNTFQVIDDSMRTREVGRTDTLMNMGEGATLSYFMDYCVENYPAEEYALIIFDHGGGPVFGMCQDELFDGDTISTDELREALRNSPFGGDRRMEWIYFATCLTGSAEIAAVCAPYADYMFASEEPGLTVAYPFSFLPDAERLDGAAVGQKVADAFHDYAQQVCDSHANTMAVYDLRQMDPLLDSLDALFGRAAADLNETTYYRFARLVAAAKEVDPKADPVESYDLLDLRTLIQNFSVLYPQEAAAAIEALDRVVICSRSNTRGDTGMSVYHLNRNPYIYSYYPDLFDETHALTPNYGLYSSKFAQLYLGAFLSSYSSVNTLNSLPLNGETAPVSAILDAGQQDGFRSAELLILEDTGTADMYRLVARKAVEPAEDGSLWTETTNEGLYVLDADGRPVTDALEYRVCGDVVELRGVLETEGTHRAMTLEDVDALDLAQDTPETLNVILRCRRQEDGSLRILYVEHVYDDGPGCADGTYIDLKNYDWLHLVTTPRQLTTAEDGGVLPYDQWKDGGVSSYRYTVDLTDDWSLAFLDDHLTWVGRSAMLVVTDLQGNAHTVAWSALENPANQPLTVGTDTLYEDETCAIAASAAWLNTSGGSASLFVRYSLTNRSDAPIVFTASEYAVDGTPLDKKDELLGTVQPGQTATAVTLIRASECEADLAEAAVLSLTFSSIDETGFGLWAPVEIGLK